MRKRVRRSSPEDLVLWDLVLVWDLDPDPVWDPDPV
jgi:hypothetical protein